MFQVTTVNLTTDTTAADIAHGKVDVGELTIDEFLALLDRFRHLDPVQNHEADPHLLVTTAVGKFRIRTGQGKLFLDNARNTTEACAELSAEEIIHYLQRPSELTALEALRETTAQAATPSRGIAAAILLAGLGLNAYTLYAVFYTETVNEKPVVAALTDPAEITAHQNDVIGTFATGAQPGDRLITIDGTGKIKFAEVDARTGYNNNLDTYRLGRLGKNYCLNTVDSGVIEVVNLNTLLYYRDTYKRR